MYREVLYLFLQRFVYRGQMAFFGTTSNPVGCAVAYRRKYVRALFDHIGPILGDDLTNSEDIFIGFAMLNEGYRNIQLTDVYARTVEPEVQRLPRQIYLWSSSFLQSCYYFDPLLRSPFKVFKRRRAAQSSRFPGSATKSGPRRLAPSPAPAMPMLATATAGGDDAPGKHARLASVPDGHDCRSARRAAGLASPDPVNPALAPTVASSASRTARHSAASARKNSGGPPDGFC